MRDEPMPPMPQPGDWVWSLDHGQVGRVVDVEHLWGEALCRVWIPLRGSRGSGT